MADLSGRRSDNDHDNLRLRSIELACDGEFVGVEPEPCKTVKFLKGQLAFFIRETRHIPEGDHPFVFTEVLVVGIDVSVSGILLS